MPINPNFTSPLWHSVLQNSNTEESPTTESEDEEVEVAPNNNLNHLWEALNSNINASTETPPVIPTPNILEYEETADDYSIKFNHCYGVLDNQLLIAMDFYNNDEGGNDIVMNYELLESSSWKSKSDGVEVIKKVDWTLPHLGAINAFNTVLFIRRRHKQSSPSRYRKGFRLDIMDIYYPSRKEFSMLGKLSDISTPSKEKEILKSIFFPNKFEVEEALDSVLSLDRLGAAFSGDYYITLSCSVNNILLWRGANIIGIWNKKFKGFDIHTSLFNDDLNSFGIRWEAA